MADEIRAKVEEALTVIGTESVAGVVEYLIEAQAEKDSAMLEGQGDIDTPKNRRGIELSTFKSILDTLSAAYHEELAVHKTGEQPVYRSEEHTSELQSLMRISYAVFCLKKKKKKQHLKNKTKM